MIKMGKIIYKKDKDKVQEEFTLQHPEVSESSGALGFAPYIIFAS